MAVRVLIAILVLAGAGVYARLLEAHRAEPGDPPPLETLPLALGTWRARDIPLSENVSRVLGADVTLQRVYRNASNQEVHVFLAYFARQAVNSQIHSPRHCVPGSGWTIVSTEPTQIPISGRSQPATRMLLEREGMRHEMLYWFQTRSGSVTGEYALKMDLLRNSLAQRPTDAVFVRYVALPQDRDALQDLLASLDHPLNELLHGAGLR